MSNEVKEESWYARKEEEGEEEEEREKERKREKEDTLATRRLEQLG